MSSALRREWVFISAFGAVALAGAALFRPLSLACSLPLWSFCSWLLYRGLPQNRRAGEPALLPALSSATHLTMLRGALSALASGFLFVPEVIAPAYTAAVLLDHADGRLARRQKRETLLGSRLDMEIDALGILVASVAGIVLGKLPTWYLAVGLARYAFIVGIRWRERWGEPVRDLDPSSLRRNLAGFQMGFLAACLWPQAPAEASLAFAYLVGGATLAMFVRDWLFVSHRLR